MIDIGRIPEGWWLASLRELRRRQISVRDKCLPTGRFLCELQHVDGGMLTTGDGVTADEAFYAAVHNVKFNERASR